MLRFIPAVACLLIANSLCFGQDAGKGGHGRLALFDDICGLRRRDWRSHQGLAAEDAMQVRRAERSSVTGLLIMAADAVLLEDGSTAFGLGIQDGGGRRVGKTNQIGGYHRAGSNQRTYTPQKPTTTCHFPNASGRFESPYGAPLKNHKP